MAEEKQGGVIAYLRSKEFRYTLAAVLVFLGIMLLLSFLWLKWYTRHGQELEMPDYTGLPYEQALADAQRHKFRMSIQDSVHILGRPGGEIIKQNPGPGSLVKARRMIYVTITKRSPDKILSSRLPEMYGKNYERKKRELEEHFEIHSRIVDTRFDPGEAGQVLEVRYKGNTIIDARGRDNTVQIDKGDYLEFIISAKTGGRVEVPDLVCKTYDEAIFLLESLGLKAGELIRNGTVEDLPSAFILAQDPPSNGTMIDLESTIRLTLQQVKPSACP